MDIFIAKIKYPNDTKNNHVPHQNFIGYINDDKIIFYSISSLTNNKMALKKYSHNYYSIISDEQTKNNFKTPSFIDCSKSYHLNIKSVRKNLLPIEVNSGDT